MSATKEYKYYFTVPTYYEYKIVAENEEQAREILVNNGTMIDGQWYDCPSGEPLLEREDYLKATLHTELTEEIN